MLGRLGDFRPSFVATTGNSGCGVFDANRNCLLGIMSRKITVTPTGGGAPKDVAKYFVPAPAIRGFTSESILVEKGNERGDGAPH